MPVINLMAFKSATRMNEGRQIAERFFGQINSEEDKPMAQVKKRMVDINKEIEWTLQKLFPATHDSEFKLRFTSQSFKQNTGVSAVYKNRFGELTLPLLHGHHG